MSNYTRKSRRFWGFFCLASLVAVGFCQRVSAAPLPGAAPLAIIHFNFYRHEVVIQAMIDGHGPYPMFLDSGTNPSVIDLSLARKLGLKLTAAGDGGTGGGTEKNAAYATNLPVVGIGGLSTLHVDSGALDLSELSRRFGIPIRGVLGDSLLSGHIVEFDYPDRIVRFLRVMPASSPNTNKHFACPFHHIDCVQIDDLSIDGKRVKGNVDTGSNSEFQITPEAVKSLGLSGQVQQARAEGDAGFNGGYQSRVGTVAEVALGTVSTAHPDVTFWMPGTGHDGATWGVNIGNLFFQHYVLTLDYRHNIFSLDRPLIESSRDHARVTHSL